MQTINYHGWTVSVTLDYENEFVATDKNGKVIKAEALSELLDMIYERTYDLKTN